MQSHSQDVKIAKKAAQAAAKIIRNYRQKENFDINFKGWNDLVTDADVEAENKIKEIISDKFPDDEFLAEESTHKDQLSSNRTWIIDPIDGTTNFAHGFPVFCVSIALWENEQPKVGIVLEVSRNELFEAVAGKGAYLNGEQIEVSSMDDPERAMIGTGFPYNDLSLLDHYISFFKWLLGQTQGVRRAGSAAYDLCCVAAGRFEGFYEYSLNPWDVGAGSLIVREAGGIITDWQGGDGWLFGQRTVAGNAAVHSFLLKALKEHFTENELSDE